MNQEQMILQMLKGKDILHGKPFIVLLIVIQMKLAKIDFKNTQKEPNDPN